MNPSEELKKVLESQLSTTLDQLKVDEAGKSTLVSAIANTVQVAISDTNLKIQLQTIFEYEQHYLELIKAYKEEIKFANTVQEDVRRERSQFFTQTLKEVIATLNSEQVDSTTASKWIYELVESYTKSLDLSSDLAKTQVVDLLGKLKEKSKRDINTVQKTIEPSEPTNTPNDVSK